MYKLSKLSAQMVHIRTVPFALAFQSASSGLESLLCGYGFRLQQSWKELSRASILTGNWRYTPFRREERIQEV